MQPNILILLSDQQRHDTIAAAGYPHMITPNLDRLAAEGVLYSHAHTANPVCMSARHDLLTGFPARVHGYYCNASGQNIKDYSTPTLPRIFSCNGYRSVAVGKMHFSPAREHHGFDEMLLMEELPEIRQEDQYASYLEQEGLGHIQNLHGVRPHIYHTPQNAQTDEAHHGTTWVANTAINWLKKNEREPFFMMCGFIQPHPPWNIPTELDGLYANRKLPTPIRRSRSEVDYTEPSPWFGDDDTPEQIARTQAAYYTAVTMVDKSAGRILDFLRQTGQLDNTLVIYTSDHGEMLYDKGYFSKEVGYEGAVRIPFIVRYPKLASPSTVNDSFIDLLDVLPTCLDVCGLNYPISKQQLFGESLFADNPKRNRNQIISASGIGPRRWVMVRNRRYKYIYNYNGGVRELYDMQEDPGETANIVQEEFCKSDFHNMHVAAVDYELQWGPQDCILNQETICYPLEKFDPSVRGKYHFWSNHQMQRFFAKSDPSYCGQRLLQEMRHAVSNSQKSGGGLAEIFNDPAWRKDFLACFQQYAESQSEKLPWEE